MTSRRDSSRAAGNSLGPTPPDSLGGAERIFARPDIGVAMLARTAALFVPCMCALVSAACGGQTHGIAATTGDGAPPVEPDASVRVEAGADSPAEASHAPSADGGPDGGADASIAEGGIMPDAGGGLCDVACSSDQDCFNACPPAFETAYCCDLATRQCFIGQDGLSCPLHPNAADSGSGGCLVTGCAAGEMCVTYGSLDPPEEPVPSCFALPATCMNDPGCACLAEAGVCQGGTVLAPCDDVDAAVIDCFN